MIKFALPLLFTVTARALNCNTGGEWANFGPSCSKTNVADADGNTFDELANACYYHSEDFLGCVPAVHAGDITITGPGCSDHGCWCVTDYCNTAEWFEAFKAEWAAVPRCFSGAAGSNEGPTCTETELHEQLEFESPSCWGRLEENVCVENNPWLGHGDGCQDDGRADAGKEACESYRDGERDPDESFDGTAKHCLWLPALESPSDKRDACEVDPQSGGASGCSLNADSGSCEPSDSSVEKWNLWQEQRGTPCEDRVVVGCVENNDHMGRASRCTEKEDPAACLAVTDEDGCSEGFCHGGHTSGEPCASRNSESECTDEWSADGPSGCSWTKQCCQWMEEPADKEAECLTNGAGTEPVCAYDDGEGAPAPGLITLGFEHGLFAKGPAFTDDGCALVATFRSGKGSATTLGANKPNLVNDACGAAGAWKSVAEHTGHTEESIDEYCANFIPEASAMAALQAYSPGEIIAKAKQYKLAELMPSLGDLLYIVTANPSYGECLFFAEYGTYGAAICTCDTPECNGEAALHLIVDPDDGPMRLLQFLDGSLAHLRDKVNSIVPGLMDDDGKIDPGEVAGITKDDVDAIMQLEGVDEKTNAEELWGIIQDFQAMLSAAEDGGDCAGITKKKKCKAASACAWNKKVKACSESGAAGGDAGEGGDACASYSKKSNCKDAGGCTWSKKAKACGSDGCSQYTKKSKCAAGGCKWKKKKKTCK